MMIDRKTVLAASGLVLVLVLIFALLRAPAPAPYTKRLTLGTIPAELSGLIWLAEDQGFFADAGLNLRVNLYETGAQAIEAMHASELDLATCAEYVAVLQMLRHQDIRILAVIGSADGFTEVLTIRNGGLVSPADLRGKKIGFPVGTHIDFYLARFLALHGLQSSDVTIVNVPPSEQQRALQEQRVDALVTFEPHLTRIKHTLGKESISWSVKDHPFYWLLVARKDTAEEQAGAVELLLSALLRSEQFLEANPAMAREITFRAIRDENLPAAISGNYSFHLTLPQPLLSVMEEQTRWILETGGAPVQKVPNYLEFIDPSALRKIKRRGVTLIE